MSFCFKIIFFIHLAVFVGISSILLAVYYDILPPVPDRPVIPKTWFGKMSESKQNDDVSIKPFRISVKDSELIDLKKRIELDLQRLSPPLEDSAFTYGFNTDYLPSVGQYWLRKYDWKSQEKMLNGFPQFTTQIDGIDVHFLHVKPDLKLVKNKKVFPLLMVHGWPGSVVEFTKIIPMLTTPNDDSEFVFEVIAPSLPGNQIFYVIFLYCMTKLHFHQDMVGLRLQFKKASILPNAQEYS